MRPVARIIPVLFLLTLPVTGICRDGPGRDSAGVRSEPVRFGISLGVLGSAVRCGEGDPLAQIAGVPGTCDFSPMFCIEPGFMLGVQRHLFTVKIGFSEKKYLQSVIRELPVSYRKYQKNQYFDYGYLAAEYVYRLPLSGDFAWEAGMGIQLRFPQKHYHTSVYLSAPIALFYKNFGLTVSVPFLIFTNSYRNWQDETIACLYGLQYRYLL